MIPTGFHQVTNMSPAGTRFACSGGALFYCRDDANEWEGYDFNALHDGYYPACTFTAVAYEDGLFYLAGNDDGGLPHVYTSIFGGVWEERNLAMLDPLVGFVRCTGTILRIVYDPDRSQIYLVCSNGQLVVLPDCPRCAKVVQVCYDEVVDGSFDGCGIVLLLADGSQRHVSADDTAQRRVSYTFARQKQTDGALLVDLRTPSEFALDPLPDSLNIPIESLDGWLRGHERTRSIIFVCGHGTQSDTATVHAQKLGFNKVYSLGARHDMVP